MIVASRLMIGIYSRAANSQLAVSATVYPLFRARWAIDTRLRGFSAYGAVVNAAVSRKDVYDVA